MSKETIIDKINKEFPLVNVYDNPAYNLPYAKERNMLYNALREAAIWGYGLSEGRIKELEGEVERLEKIIEAIPIIK